MTDKDILTQIKGADKIKPYAVDDEAIRRGKANLALMMTLTTADHYDWFIGKFTSHNYFDFHGYRVYRRNVSKPPMSIPHVEIEKLRALDRELLQIQQKHLYASPSGPKDLQLDLVNRIHKLTPLILNCAADLTQEHMHYVGEICDVLDQPVADSDLVKIYSISNHYTDEKDAVDHIFADFDIPTGSFESVPIDERTHWGMVSCPKAQYFSSGEPAQTILFEDQLSVLGEVWIDDKTRKLTPHTQWVKSVHEYKGVELTVPFSKPYPLWNLPSIQERKERVVLLTDNLLLAYQKQCQIDKQIQKLVTEEWDRQDKSDLYTKKNDWNNDFEKKLRATVQEITKTKYEQIEQEADDYFTTHRISVPDTAWAAVRLLYLHDPVYTGPIQKYSNRREKGSPRNLVNAFFKVYGEILPSRHPEEVFKNLSGLQLTDQASNTPGANQIEDLPLGPHGLDYLDSMYKTLCAVIEERLEEDNRAYEKLKSEKFKAQEFCWSSWFGGDEALADVNWRELRKRDVVYVLTNMDEHSYRTALAVYERIKRICNSIRFTVKNKIVSAENFIASAKSFGLSPENLKVKAEPVSMFETFDPNAELPKRLDFIIDPIISERSITLMYAPTGIGKTWFAMCIALAASHGKGLFSNSHNSWNAPKPRRVVYLDSEMSEYNFKKRLQVLNQMYESENQNLSFKLVAGENFNLTDETKGYCDQITQWLNDEAVAGRPVDLLILDNLTTLTGFNDSAKSWETLFSWMKALKEKRHHPCSILVVHHSNKKGDQRGTSTKTATVDNVIKLDKIKQDNLDIVPKDSLRFSVTIEKGRDMESIPPQFSVELQLPSRANAKPSCRVVNINKDESSRTDEAIQYLKGEKAIPHKVIAALTDLRPEYIRQLSFKIKSRSKKGFKDDEEDEED